jgi:hypothetical protein
MLRVVSANGALPANACPGTLPILRAKPKLDLQVALEALPHWPHGGALCLEFPALGNHHLLEGHAFHAFGVADEGDFSVLRAPRMLVGDYRPVRTAILRHRDDKWIGAIDAFVWLVRVVVCRHERPHDLLHRNRLLHEEVGLRLAPFVAIVPGFDFIKDSLRRLQPTGCDQFLNALLPQQI